MRSWPLAVLAFVLAGCGASKSKDVVLRGLIYVDGHEGDSYPSKGSANGGALTLAIDPVPSPIRGAVNQTFTFSLGGNARLAQVNATLFYGAIQDDVLLASDARSVDYRFPAGAYPTAKVRLRAYSTAGDLVTVDSNTFYVDGAPPTLTIAPLPAIAAATTSARVSLTCTDDDQVASSACKRVDQDMWLETTAGVVDVPLPAMDMASAVISCRCLDRVGNETDAESAPFVVDASAPLLTLDALPSPLRGGAQVVVTWRAVDVDPALGHLVELSLDDGGTYAPQAGTLVVAPPSVAVTITLPFADTLAARVRVTSTDSTGHGASAVTPDFVIDSTPPLAPSVTMQSPATAPYTNTLAVALAAAACATTEPIAGIFIEYGNMRPDPAASGWQACSTLAMPTTLVDAEGMETAYAWAKDAAGNVSTTAGSAVAIYDKTPPALAFTGVVGPYAGGTPVSLAWTISEVNAAASASFTVEASADGGSSWMTVGTPAGLDGPLVLAPFSLPWAWPAWDSAAVTLRVSFTDQAGNTGSGTLGALVVDSSPPLFSAGAFKLNGGAPGSITFYVQVALNAVDALTNVTHFCLKHLDATPPVLADPCWIPVDAPAPGLTPQKTLTLPGYTYILDVEPTTYTVNGWARDQLGHISVYGATDGKDRASILYNPGSPPTLINVIATSSDTPATPPSVADLTVAPSGDVYIKWTASDAEGLVPNPISLYWTTDDATYTQIASDQPNAVGVGAGAGCTIAGAYTGCYHWQNAAGAGYVKLRVSARDTYGGVKFASAAPLNVFPPFNFLAGNTDPGLGSSANSAVFFSFDLVGEAGRPGLFVVANDGTLYYLDTRGLLAVSPLDGVQRLLIPTTGAASTDPGPVGTATLGLPVKLALDHQNGLLIWDGNRIRRIDLQSQQIANLIGGGASVVDGALASDVHMDVPNLSTEYVLVAPLFALPNGDVYFDGDNYQATIAGGSRIRVYHALSGTVTSIVPSGLGDSANPTQDVSQCGLGAFGVRYDVVSSALSSMQAYIRAQGGGCVNGNGGLAALDPLTFVSTAPHPPDIGGAAALFQGMDGNLYTTNRAAGILSRWNGSGWDRVLGTGSVGHCDDGTPALACNTAIKDAFVSSAGRVYFAEQTQVRMLKADATIITLAGQSLSYGDGGHPLSARFGGSAFGPGPSGTLVVFDTAQLRMREVTIDTTVQTIAGNGNLGQPSYAVAATGTSLNIEPIYFPRFVVDPGTGDVYQGPGYHVDRLNRATGMWQPFAGAGALYSVANGDGHLGSEVAFPATYFGSTTGFGGGEVFIATTGNNADSFFKLYSVGGDVQSHLAGVTGPLSPTGLCADGTALSACQVPFNHQYAISYAEWDGVGGRWLMRAISDNIIRTLPPGGNIGTLVTLQQATTTGFAYRRNGPSEYIYYCSNSGRLYKRDVSLGADVALPWPVPSITCAARVFYDAGRGSLLFSYAQNNLSGIAEYLNP